MNLRSKVRVVFPKHGFVLEVGDNVIDKEPHEHVKNYLRDLVAAGVATVVDFKGREVSAPVVIDEQHREEPRAQRAPQQQRGGRGQGQRRQAEPVPAPTETSPGLPEAGEDPGT